MLKFIKKLFDKTEAPKAEAPYKVDAPDTNWPFPKPVAADSVPVTVVESAPVVETPKAEVPAKKTPVRKTAAPKSAPAQKPPAEKKPVAPRKPRAPKSQA